MVTEMDALGEGRGNKQFSGYRLTFLDLNANHRRRNIYCIAVRHAVRPYGALKDISGIKGRFHSAKPYCGSERLVKRIEISS